MSAPRMNSGTTPARRPRTLLAMGPDLLPSLFDEPALTRLNDLADLVPDLVLTDLAKAEHAVALAQAEVLLACWGCPPLDERLLAAAPRLRAVVYAAGSVKGLVTDACWQRGIQVSTGAWANARPVAEYTVAAILFSNKRVLDIRDRYRTVREAHNWRAHVPDLGNYRRTVGIVGASLIGRRVIELLRPYDLHVVVYDPYLADAEAQALGVGKVELDELCKLSDVVTLHAPLLPTTEGMLDKAMLALMRDGTTLINTARGALVDTDALTTELLSGRLRAVVDHLEPEVPPADSPLYDLPNLLLTPHIAGSFGNELHRLGDAALDELARYTSGLPFAHAVRPELLDRTA
ncbi:hydroxyacid dehydrogenase [Streptacidiphilus sp. MAP5-52]|uniref:hydroxyacid dehydrogenase n=1 Tax=Streptacidiphilus sp. MAP5-52 TaxID=3156267 RepID=UPI0035143884